MNDSADLFRHVSAEKALFYRAIMDVFAAAKRQYRLRLRPDEVLAEARFGEPAPRIEDVNAELRTADSGAGAGGAAAGRALPRCAGVGR